MQCWIWNTISMMSFFMFSVKNICSIPIIYIDNRIFRIFYFDLHIIIEAKPFRSATGYIINGTTCIIIFPQNRVETY